MARRRKNEGSLYKKADGKWRAQIRIDGQRLSFTDPSLAACQAWLRETMNQIDQGLNFKQRKLELGTYLDQWISIKKTALRPLTGQAYEQLITLYIKPKLGRLKLIDLTQSTINRFYNKLLQEGVGVWSIHYTHRVLRAALGQAVTNGVLARNPCKGAILPRRGHREMQILNEQQVNQFLTVASHSRYAALFRLAITSGMRLSELRGLYWSDLDWFKGTLTVRRQIQDDPHKGSFVGAPKTRSSKRTIMLGQATLDELRRHQERLELEKLAAGDKWQENSLVFPSTIGTPFGQKNLHDEFSKVLTDADLPRIRFHDLRHTAASLMLNHGVPVLVVSQILGHSNPSVTLNVYAHCLVDMQHQAAGVMDQIVTPIPVDVPKKPVTIPRSGK